MEENYYTFATKADVIKFLEDNGYEAFDDSNIGKCWISGDSGGIYYLSHGEYSAPDYRPRRYKDGWGIHIAYYYYQGTYNAPRSGRISGEDLI